MIVAFMIASSLVLARLGLRDGRFCTSGRADAGCRPCEALTSTGTSSSRSVDMAVVVVRQFAGRMKLTVTCRKRKHIRLEPSGMAL
jgi:hypothetical protein